MKLCSAHILEVIAMTHFVAEDDAQRNGDDFY